MALNKRDIEEFKDEVKSTAVVKFSVPMPTNFLQLKPNTNIWESPPNWFQQSDIVDGLKHSVYAYYNPLEKEFSSFRMANLFPDCIGEVDVVSDAENIKNLLKIPYNKKQISMVVHKVGNTLLLDNYALFERELNKNEMEWEWLQKFILKMVRCKTVRTDKIRRCTSLKSRDETLLLKKFLYHSLVQNEEDIYNRHELKPNILPSDAPILPEPSQKEKVPNPKKLDKKYNRNVVWSFEDIEMLIGTDMPIFGGGTHPCISLHLHDMKKPINVLTGIDYWLDNLMSNVPEVLMCYHLNGIVQKYELVKTEDLPNFENSKFSPNLIRDVAQSILSFLKSNATIAGHTYWLFKAKDEMVVKLYDLTCMGTPNDKDTNPFTVPVAMLLYRVARNMKHSKDSYQPGTIRMLLENCIKLLQPEKYAEIVTSSHYMLSDLYVPVETNPENPNLTDEIIDEQDYFDESMNINDDNPVKSLNIDIDTIYKSDKTKTEYKPPPPITGSVDERSLKSLLHVAHGLTYLQYFKNPADTDPDNVKMANPSEPIPMPFTETKQTKEEDEEEEETKQTEKKVKKRSKGKKNRSSEPNSLLPKNKADSQAQPLPTWQESQKNIRWKDHLKILLYEKIVLVYAILSENNFKLERFGDCLRCLGILFRAILVANKFTPGGCSLKLNCIYERAGDCFLMIVHNWQKCDNFRLQLNTLNDVDEKILEKIKNEERHYHINLLHSNFKCIAIYDFRTIEQILLNCLACYEEAFKLSSSKVVNRRLGNSLNEIGSYYLNQAKSATSDKTIKEFCIKSEPYLKRAAEVFHKEEDYANTALINANLGHLHRLMSYSNSSKDNTDITIKERTHFKKALNFYSKAIKVLGERNSYPAIWDAVNWEISSTYFTFAKRLQESYKDFSQIEKEVVQMLHYSLDYCSTKNNPANCHIHHMRVGCIHHKLGSIYHGKVVMMTATDAKKKKSIMLGNVHYGKAAEMFEITMDPLNYFTAQMQKFALTEWNLTAFEGTELKHVKLCLDILLESKFMVQMLAKGLIEINESDIATFDLKDLNGVLPDITTVSRLLMFVKQRIQEQLKRMVKLSIIQVPFDNNLVLIYKKCYSYSFKLDDCANFNEFLVVLSDTMFKIHDKLNENDL